MPRPTIPLDVINVAEPCPVDWNDMRGDERVRFCEHCSLHVYNLSGMTRSAAEELVSGSEGRLCVRFFRRADGTVITRDCENAWKRAAKRAGRLASAAAGLALAAVLAPFGWSKFAHGSSSEKCEAPRAAAREVVGDVVTPEVLGRIPAPQDQRAVIMGEIAPVMGMVAPPPATRPAPPATQPTTQLAPNH